MRPSQPFLIAVLTALAGGDSFVRDVAAWLMAFAGVHLHVPNCYVGSGPAC